MGLDMYLYTNSRAVCEDVHKDSDNRFYMTQNGIAIQWRKANAIHGWFDRHIGPLNNCDVATVEVDDLIRLHDDCVDVLTSTALIDGFVDSGKMTAINGNICTVKGKGRILQNPSVAKEKLPTMSGSLFGSTDYDESYYEQVKRTKVELAKILELLKPDKETPWNTVHKDEPGWFVRFYYQADW